MQQPAERPLGVTLIAILLAVNGIVVLVGSIATFAPEPGGNLAAIIGVIFGIALLYLAYGMWTLQDWAWWTTVVLEGINAIFAIVALVVAPGAIATWITLALALIIIAYLVQPNVRDDFVRRRAGQ